MRKSIILFVLALTAFSAFSFAQEAVKPAAGTKAAMMKVYACPMDGYVSEKPGKCPSCGMDLAETEMPADEAKSLLEKEEAGQ